MAYPNHAAVGSPALLRHGAKPSTRAAYRTQARGYALDSISFHAFSSACQARVSTRTSALYRAHSRVSEKARWATRAG